LRLSNHPGKGASFGFGKGITRGDRTMEKKRISAISTDLSDDAVVEMISGELRKLLADRGLFPRSLAHASKLTTDNGSQKG
jgi:hypothetical protein